MVKQKNQFQVGKDKDFHDVVKYMKEHLSVFGIFLNPHETHGSMVFDNVPLSLLREYGITLKVMETINNRRPDLYCASISVVKESHVAYFRHGE